MAQLPDLPPALRALSASERIQLAEDLWDSVATEAPDAAFPVSAELAAELERRAAEHEAHPETARPWDEVRAEIAQRLAGLAPATRRTA